MPAGPDGSKVNRMTFTYYAPAAGVGGVLLAVDSEIAHVIGDARNGFIFSIFFCFAGARIKIFEPLRPSSLRKPSGKEGWKKLAGKTNRHESPSVLPGG